MVAHRPVSVATPRPPFVPNTSFMHLFKSVQDRLLYALNICACLSHTKEVHVQILQYNLQQCSYLLTKLLRTLSKLNVPVEPYQRSIFDLVDSPSPFLYNALIRGYLIEGKLTTAVNVYAHLRRECTTPLSFTFSAMFKGCAETTDVHLGRQFHVHTVIIGGCSSDLVVNNAMMDMYAKCEWLDCARKLFDEMSKKDVFSWTNLIVAFAKRGNMQYAKQLFDRMPDKDMVAWTAMVNGFAQNARPHDSIRYFLMMLDAGVKTDDIALLGFISACAQLGTNGYDDLIHDVAKKCSAGDRRDIFLESALIDMYSKSGNVDVAYEVFQQMRDKNVYSYSSMIHGFALHGRFRDAFRLFDEMLENNMKPNQVTLTGMLSVCSHTGMWQEGLQIFESIERYSISPSLELYTTLVDMLGRAGFLREALFVAKLMPEKGELWSALLNACNIHGDHGLAEIAAYHLFRIEPDIIGNYLLLCSTYFSVGRLEDVSRIRNFIQTKGLIHNPGCSSIETMDGLTHEFHEQDKLIYLPSQIRSCGS